MKQLKKPIEVEAGTMPEALRMLKASVPTGHILISYSTLSSGGSIRLSIFGETIEEAIKNAHAKLGAEITILKETGLSEKTQQVEARNEAEAKTKVFLGTRQAITGVRLVKGGIATEDQSRRQPTVKTRLPFWKRLFSAPSGLAAGAGLDQEPAALSQFEITIQQRPYVEAACTNKVRIVGETGPIEEFWEEATRPPQLEQCADHDWDGCCCRFCPATRSMGHSLHVDNRDLLSSGDTRWDNAARKMIVATRIFTCRRCRRKAQSWIFDDGTEKLAEGSDPSLT